MSVSRARAYIGLGSNLDDPRQQVSSALNELGRLPETSLVDASSLYRSPPLGPPGQPDYVNAVAALETGLAPAPLLAALQALEQRHGRVRAERWGPRTLDLDILVYGDLQSDDPELTLPHPQLARRDFVLVPLHEIAPELEICGLGRVVDLLAGLPQTTLVRLPG